jgi:hypothetical protein
MLPTVGVCLEFGPPIGHGCDHAMVAADQRCVCPQCGAVCRGRFQGCPSVWSRGPQPLSLVPGPVAGRSVIFSTGAGEEKTDAGVSADAPILPADDPPPTPNDGAGVVGPLEPTAITELAQALADAIATVGRQLHEGQEFQLRSLLDKIESRLDELRAAAPEPRTSRSPPTADHPAPEC